MCNSPAVVWNFDELNWWNGAGAFLAMFYLGDLIFYFVHRAMHRVPWLYRLVHKHHHEDAAPFRGWVDACNAHPLDYFNTGFFTSPLSTLWLMPTGSVHVVAIAACLYLNCILGSLGHSRLDINVPFFSTRTHAGHHCYPNSNFGQTFEIWDQLFGTYRDYGYYVDKTKKMMMKKKI